MRRAALALAITCLLGCAGTAVFPVALGARDRVPTWNGPCDPARIEGDAITLLEGGYVAEHPGEVDWACRDGTVRISVREIATLVIDGPPSIGTDWTTYRLVAEGQDGTALDLGSADVEWTIPDSIERGPSCHGEFAPSCDPPSVVRLRARGSACVRLTARFAGREQARTLTCP